MFALDDSPTGGTYLRRAIELLEKANAELEPELLDSSGARAVLEGYAGGAAPGRSRGRGTRSQGRRCRGRVPGYGHTDGPR